MLCVLKIQVYRRLGCLIKPIHNNFPIFIFVVKKLKLTPLKKTNNIYGKPCYHDQYYPQIIYMFKDV